MEGTITLKRPVKAAVKKNDVIDIAVHLDGRVQEMSFFVPMSTSLTSGQRADIRGLIAELLGHRFGRVIEK